MFWMAKDSRATYLYPVSAITNSHELGGFKQ